MVPTYKVIPQYRPETKTTRSSRKANVLDQPDADPLGFRRVFTQVAHDLYGTKDVQDAITASYVWMADQTGFCVDRTARPGEVLRQFAA